MTVTAATINADAFTKENQENVAAGLTWVVGSGLYPADLCKLGQLFFAQFPS